MSGGGVPVLGDKAAMLGAIETQIGMRCGGCGERISKGVEFVVMDVVHSEQGPAGSVMSRYACDREDCDFVGEASRGATACRPVEWLWPQDAEPVDQPVNGSEPDAA